MDDGQRARLSEWLAGIFEAQHVRLTTAEPLRGGAIQENWLIETLVEGGPRAGEQGLVLRKDAPAAIASSHSRQDEFHLLALAHRRGVTVPEPVAFCADPAVLGQPFALMARVPGKGFGPQIVKDQQLGGDRRALAYRLGEELARIHALQPEGPEFAFLGPRPKAPAAALVTRLRASLDRMGLIRPELEWGLRFVEVCAPAPQRIVLCHHDFRTGNYLVDAQGLTAILDWEFAGWGDPMADLGWFTALCWRFSRPDLEAGGIGMRADFYAGYAASAGHEPDDDVVRFWEIVAHLRWAVIALEQGFRHISGEERSLELALTGRMAAELERTALLANAPERWSRR
jgi:aminoglycoside phosphotransferase (APT) family kinase protein